MWLASLTRPQVFEAHPCVAWISTSFLLNSFVGEPVVCLGISFREQEWGAGGVK